VRDGAKLARSVRVKARLDVWCARDGTELTHGVSVKKGACEARLEVWCARDDTELTSSVRVKAHARRGWGCDVRMMAQS
jgi:hypothetical protein